MDPKMRDGLITLIVVVVVFAVGVRGHFLW
jgi:hypothetical protein